MKVTDRDTRYLTTEQARDYLNLGSVNAVYRLIREWQLPYGRVGRTYRFNRRHLDLWIERRGVAAIASVKASA